ncbi:MerR family transcriptional regulator [Kribbella sandramycini]|uniref:DNA-binding transcriptional MerR regulator n=1 Tax=Kribbella sandramycini TaxID=60450 RepID=A0A7Y4KZV6_9ACTN|nr:MerR family transcriptional regulator [Kribbella sandramycini]MBB6565447.1 DNA-binding transcriptional MerR regulator [Kribbella sandramycini]NOL41715.1 MerR family transcriptional regulator [Kribbella sandramycini]
MRIGELSRATGIPVPTIKYYLREGLLPAGELSSPNQAAYGEAHVRRLRLVRALVDLAQVPVAQVKEIVASLDADDVPLHDQIGRAHRALIPARKQTASAEAREVATAEVRELLQRRGWQVEADGPALATLIETVATFHTLGQQNLVGFLDAYAAAVEQFTELEVEAVTAHPTRDQVAESVVIGTILGETVISSLRLLAQESISARRWS